MKNLLGGLLLVLGIAGGLQASAGLPVAMPVRFEDGTQGRYITTTLLKFTTIQELIEDLGYDDSVVLPIPCTRQQFEVFVAMSHRKYPSAPNIQDYKELVWLLKWAMFLGNEQIEGVLALELLKRLDNEAYDSRPEMLDYIASVNPDIFFVISDTVAPLIAQGIVDHTRGAAVPAIEQKLGMTFENISYFVYQGLNEQGEALIRTGIVDHILKSVKGMLAIRQNFKELLLIVKMFLGISPAWDFLGKESKALLKAIIADALKEKSGTGARLCIDYYPQLASQVFADGSTPLIMAVGSQPDDVVKKIIEISPDTIDAKNADGDTALMVAVLNKRFKTIKALLTAGADPTIQNEAGETASTRAYFSAHPEIIAFLPQPDVNDPRQRRHLLQNLDQAVERSDLMVMKAILGLGISPNEYAQYNNGSTRDTIGIEAIKKLKETRHTDNTPLMQNQRKGIVRFIVNNYPDFDPTSRFDPSINYYIEAFEYADTDEVRARLRSQLDRLERDVANYSRDDEDFYGE